MTKEQIDGVFMLVNLPSGRSFGSKSAYRAEHVPNRYVPNCSIYVTNGPGALSGKLWYGDIDALRDARSLIGASRLLHRKLYLLTEADGRWNRKELSDRDLAMCAVATVWRGKIGYSATEDPDGLAWW